MSFFEAITSKRLEDQFDKGTDTIQSWQAVGKRKRDVQKRTYICLTHDLARKILKVRTENLSSVGFNYSMFYFTLMWSVVILHWETVAALITKKKAAWKKIKTLERKEPPETNCYLTPMRPRQNIQYQHRAADNVRKWKGYDRRAAALMAHPSSRLFSCNKVIVHRIAWNGWYISALPNQGK